MPSPTLRRLRPLACCALLLQLSPAQGDANPARDVVAAHAAWCHATYDRCVHDAEQLVARIDALLADPTFDTLTAARRAWLTARDVYCRTEVLRFHDGPIEPIEPCLNAWPIDEAWIDYVAGQPNAGIVNDPVHYPALTAAVLQLANERGGEANVTMGWHAIEFLLWGQDHAADGPGQRPATDFVVGEGKHADRRGAYLRAVARQLLADLRTLRTAWAPDTANYRRTFVAEPDASVRRMLVGAVVLTAFELAGERLTVALETRDQEQEHSCFADSTSADLAANQRGIVEVLRGDAAARRPGVIALLRARDEALAARLDAALTRTTAAIAAIPAPFDRAFLGEDDAPGRRAIRAAIAALEHQADTLLLVGKAFGHDLPLAPN
jgi:putative iron-regulated protein